MFEKSRHVPLRTFAWDISEARAAINEIVDDARTAFSETGFWHAHPQDEGVTDGDTSIYFGACGIIWGLDYLARCGATQHTETLTGL
jgi:hypothetical protein